MITVAYTDMSHEVSDELVSIWLNELPANKKTSVDRSLERGNGRATLFGLQLLKKAALAGNKRDIRIADIRFESGKKPVIDNGPDFSISHSGNIVVCAVACQGRVGIDVEKIRPVRMEPLARRIASAEDKHVPASQKEFFDLWTQKEAVAKAVGSSVAVLGNIAVRGETAIFENDLWHLRRLDLGAGYAAHLACDQKDREISVVNIGTGALVSDG